MNRKIIITPKGYSTLKEKIVRLKKKQEKTAEKLNFNRGDISENADFSLLEEKNLNLLREIEETENILERSEVRKKINNKNLAELGSILTYL
jgi:transcription elongation GreA/GreB family factor